MEIFTANNIYIYVSSLPEMLEPYTYKRHNSINMTSKQASKQSNKGNLYGDLKISKCKPKFKIGDRVC